MRVALTKGRFAEIDEADWPRISAYRWYFGAGGYAVSKRIGLMHCFLLGRRGIDHINGDGLDNRRSNLRPCTQAQNAKNRVASTRNKSGFKGVSFEAFTGRWRATIRSDYKQINLGRFDAPEDAARAYDAAARKYFGEFARLNFPTPAHQAEEAFR